MFRTESSPLIRRQAMLG